MRRVKLDRIDKQILAELQADGRISNVDLARKVGLSAPPCLRRVRTLEEEGFIHGYHADVDAERLGYAVSAFAMVGLSSQAESDLKAFEERVRGWLAGNGGLPGETRAYVIFVTGRAAEEWKLPETDLPESLKTTGDVVQQSCKALAPLVVRAVYETEPLTASGAWRPWGAHVSSAFSKAKALAMFARLRREHVSVLADREPFVTPVRNLSRGRRALYQVQIGADSRADASEICAALRRDGGACIVQRN